MRYVKIIDELYNDYCKLLPLDLADEKDAEKINTWKNDIRYSQADFARLLNILCTSTSLDEFVKGSGGDFDNLAGIVKVAVMSGVVTISKSGSITANDEKLKTISIDSDQLNTGITPNADYNQFPCDEESADRRAKYILSRHPYTKSLKVGLIGDDDFISLRFLNLPTISTIVIEKDERIIDTIRQAKEDSDTFIIEQDVREITSSYDIDTFVTDPPYTFDGSLAFIVCGLSMMGEQKGKEFYVILNPTMMGSRLFRLIEALAQNGITVINIEKNISNYRLPGNFSERHRADKFLEELGIDGKSLQYSSSSTMYTFFTKTNVDTNKLRKFLSEDKIYEHY